MTIHRPQIEQNLRSYQPLRHLPLTPAHCQARLRRTPWTIIRGTLTAQWCINDILRTVLLPFLLKYIDLFFRRYGQTTCGTYCYELSYSLSNTYLAIQIMYHLKEHLVSWKKLEFAASNVACNTMKEAALEIRSNETDTEFSQCGVSVDGTWQRRGYSSLNGCVSVISIDSGKVLDVEFMSKVCRLCNSKNKKLNNIHNCAKHIGSSGAMEPLGVYRIFERSVEMRKLHKIRVYWTHTKRVGTKLRKLKSKRKDLGGRGKLTDAFIDKLQNYYGIAIRDNVNNLQGMQRAVIAAFFHCCSNAKQQMHGQCPVGPDSWCKYQQAVSKDKIYIDKSKGLPPNLINIMKPTYMKLCDQNLLAKCLPGKTQNSN
ncbi:uncharacterized protein TNCV_271321 [Trichonephila clavipes]|nr:uncharacterized protein TNCV_271321 [Trichonephila clavipes]